MADLELVRETFASLPDEKLIHLANGDLAEMTPGAYEILKEEFTKRQLNINDYLIKVYERVLTEEPVPELESETSHADPAIPPITYTERLAIRAHWIMFLFAILIGIGILVIVDAMTRRGADDRPVFGYVAISLGLLGIIAAWYRKRIYRKQLIKFDFEKEKMNE